MENYQSEKNSTTDVPVPFRDRFALQIWDAVIVGIVAALVGGWVVMRGNQASGGLLGRPLRVGIVSWPGYAGGLVANNGLRPNKDSAFWGHKLLVEFVLVEDEDQLRRDFERGGEHGGVDIMWSTVDSLAQQAPAFLNERVHPRAFMQVDWSRGGDAIIASEGIERIEDLKGKRIAVSMSASQWLLEYNLENSSLTEAERTEIRMARRPTRSSQEAGELFANRSVDAAVLWEPDVTEALKQRSGKRLVDTKMAANLIADVMVAKEEFIQQYPNVIAAFIEGWLEGTTKAINDPMLAVKVLQDEPDFAKLGEEKTHELLGKTALATLDDNVEMFGLSGGELFFDHLFNWASDLWLKRGYITARVPAEQARHLALLKEIYGARQGSAASRPGCGPETQTIELAIAFPPGKAEIGEEARRILDNQAALFMLQTHTGAHFCVQAAPDEGNAPQHAFDISGARENAVIEYLVKHYNRSPSQFMAASATPSGTASTGAATPYIRLKLISAGTRQ